MQAFGDESSDPSENSDCKSQCWSSAADEHENSEEESFWWIKSCVVFRPRSTATCKVLALRRGIASQPQTDFLEESR